MRFAECVVGQRVVVRDPHIGRYSGVVHAKGQCSLEVRRDGFLGPVFVPESYFYGGVLNLVDLEVGQLCIF